MNTPLSAIFKFCTIKILFKIIFVAAIIVETSYLFFS